MKEKPRQLSAWIQCENPLKTHNGFAQTPSSDLFYMTYFFPISLPKSQATWTQRCPFGIQHTQIFNEK